MTPIPERYSVWQWPQLIVFFTLAALLYTSWQLAATREYWEWVDTHVFYAMNGLLKDNYPMQVLWGLMNHRLFDLIPAAVLLGSFSLYVVADDKKYFNERVAQGLFMAVYIVLIIQIFRRTMPEERLSPSLLLEPVYRLSQLVPGINPKDHTYESFPADHASIFIMVGAFMYHYYWRSRIWLLIVLGAIFCMPRLVAGAHWFSDMAVGAVVITLAATSLAIHTPLEAIGVRWAYRLVMYPPVQRIILAIRSKITFFK